MPVIPITSIDKGWHEAVVESFELRDSSNNNPMIVVELLLDTGEMINGYLVITTHAEELTNFLTACGRNDLSILIRKKKMPDYELNELEGTKILVDIDWRGQPCGYRKVRDA